MSKSVRQFVQFLEPPGDDFKCPICLEILQEPHLTTCCGNHHLCKVCMDKVKEANGRCPLCKEKPFNGFIDKRFERQLHELKVYCLYASKGCTWVGNLGKLDYHLNIGRENGECQFVVIECPISVECKEHFLRKHLLNHIDKLCKYRQVECIYCGFASTYQNITTLHAKNCTKYPLLCPNNCSNQTYPRDQLNAHLASCPEQEVDCTFSEVGCKKKVKRWALQQHLDNNLLQHQVVMCQTIREMKREKQEVEEQLESLRKEKKEFEMKMSSFSNQEDNQSKTLKFIAKRSTHLQSMYFYKMVEFSDLHPVAPLVLKTSLGIKQVYIHSFNTFNMGSHGNFNHYTAKPYHSQFFYSHQNGYKLQLLAEIICHCPNCKNPQRKTVQNPLAYPQNPWQGDGYNGFGYVQQQADHTQSYHPEGYFSVAVNLYVFKGDHDSQLKWPFKKEITISMYHENNNTHKTHTFVDFRRRSNEKYEYHKIPHEIAIFEGNQNHTSSGSKLGIESLIETNEDDLAYLLRPRLHTVTPKRSHIRPDNTLLDGNDIKQQKLHFYMEKGLLLPLNLHRDNSQSGWPRNDQVFNETVYFEVTISP